MKPGLLQAAGRMRDLTGCLRPGRTSRRGMGRARVQAVTGVVAARSCFKERYQVQRGPVNEEVT